MGIYTEAIQKLYVAYFNRPGDVAGQTYWENVVANAKGNTSAVSAAFAASAEYKAAYAGQTEYQIINKIYNNLFGRDAEPAGLTFWGQALINKAITIDLAVKTISEAAQGTDATAFKNKVAAATVFTAALDTSTEILAYSGDLANGVGKSYIASVTTDASLATAISTANLDATIAAVIAAAPQQVGTTFTLTQGLDTIIGTANNDTINVHNFNTTTGALQTNLSAFDSVDGSAGNDTLNIDVTGGFNSPITGTIKNVETINITGGPVAVDASKFVGATNVNQIGAAGAVTNLAATTTATFTGIGAAAALSVAAAGTSAKVALSGVDETATVAVSGTTLNSVTVSGTRVDGADAGTTVSALALTVTAGTDVQSVSVNTAGATTLTVVDAASAATKKVTTVDASASAGAVTFAGDAETVNILSGAGADDLTVTSATVVASTGVTAVSATVTSGAGNDKVTVSTTGTGATTVNTGAGDDTVNVTARGTGVLTVDLGDGVDTFTSTVAVNATDVINAGAGVDTLLLSLVGAANIGAFSGFDIFDTVGLSTGGDKTLDVDILASKNTVTEFVASGSTGGIATLTNIGAGVGFRATADMAASSVVLTQKAAGAITVTVDADETAAADTAADTAVATVSATNASSVKAVFDTAFKASITGEGAAGDNVATLNLTAAAATSVEVVSGGALANNVLVLIAGEATTVTITGDRALNLSGAAAKLGTIDGSAATGGLTVSTAMVKDGGTIKLGSGADIITIGAASVPTGIESVSGFEKTAAAAVGTDATAAAAAQVGADVLVAAGATLVADAIVLAGGSVGTKGVLTFTGAGPTTLDAAIVIAASAAQEGEVVAFEYLGNSYVYANAATDVVVKLVGITGITNLAEVGTDGTSNTFFIV
ncbi:DUF4214 domain-containing protein [Massilia cavernae]|uniref:DUF4214 domain-containing protein n=1 Tax=Massilia cavernae TaxID=2320864 RepID=A0A418XGY8_9BURK|nr:DUF4214 domain-containing protein [Massilia cavernae]RJG11730.1 DUF4214 domain-containing protein [Massilia cavernae]